MQIVIALTKSKWEPGASFFCFASCKNNLRHQYVAALVQNKEQCQLEICWEVLYILLIFYIL